MTSKIVITGDNVELIEEQVTHRQTLDAFIANLAKPSLWWGPLPMGTTFIHQTDTDTNLIVELAPGPRTLMVWNTPVTLSMPWQYWQIVVPADSMRPGKIAIWWRPSRLLAPTDPLWIASLPNIGTGGWVCMGSMDGQPVQRDNGPQSWDDVAAYIDRYYLTDSNADLGWNIPLPFRTFAEWAKATTADPMVALRLPMFATTPLSTLQTPQDTTRTTRVDVSAFIAQANLTGTSAPDLLYPDLSLDLLVQARDHLNHEISARQRVTELTTLTPPTTSNNATFTIDPALYRVDTRESPENLPNVGTGANCDCTWCGCARAHAPHERWCTRCRNDHVFRNCQCDYTCSNTVTTEYSEYCDACDDNDHSNCQESPEP